MKSIIYTNNASFTALGKTFDKNQAYNVSDTDYEYLMKDYGAWFVVGRPMEVEPVASQPVEPVASQPVEPVVEPVTNTKPKK